MGKNDELKEGGEVELGVDPRDKHEDAPTNSQFLSMADEQQEVLRQQGRRKYLLYRVIVYVAVAVGTILFVQKLQASLKFSHPDTAFRG